MLRCTLVSVCFFLPCLVFAQSDHDGEVHHHNVAFGVGPAMPVGNGANFLSTAPFIRVGYGYRFNRLFQGDFAFQMAFGAANNQNAVVTDLGQVKGGDHEFMIPLGGRIYIPQPIQRIQLSAGVGTVYLHYSETASSAGGYYGYSNTCYTCTSRGGWGAYGLADVSYFLDSNHNLRVGTTLQYIVGHTNGGAVANFPAIKTIDHWFNLAFVIGLSF